MTDFEEVAPDKPMIPLPSDLIASLCKVGFLTGSRAYGTARKDSDWDIVYAVQDSEEIDGILEGLERVRSGYNDGFCVTVLGTKINLIPVHPHEFLPWYLTTKAMTATLKASGIKDPVKKYALFEIVTGAFRGLCDQLGSTQGYNEIKKKIVSGTL